MKNYRSDFPFFTHQKDLIYFDSASTAQKPEAVIQRIQEFYAKEYASVHRCLYEPGEQATKYYEETRKKCAEFINADFSEIIFTKGTTEGINFVATAWGREKLSADDEIVITQLEHHSNMVPWQQVAKKTGAILKYIPLTKEGYLDLQNLDEIITPKTKLVAFSGASNVLGTPIPIQMLVEKAKAVGALVLIDAAQAVAHHPIDVKKMGVDFLAFSGHKMMGPSGIGVLYIKKEVQEQVVPYQFGGSMVSGVWEDRATWQEAPGMYEAGTPPIAQVIGLGAAIDYYRSHIDWEELARHEASLCSMALDELKKLDRVHIVGPSEPLKKHGHLVSFVIDGIHVHDVAAYLDKLHICVRAGHHCAQPLHRALGIHASIRASFFAYNTQEEVERFIQAIQGLLSQI